MHCFYFAVLQCCFCQKHDEFFILGVIVCLLPLLFRKRYLDLILAQENIVCYPKTIVYLYFSPQFCAVSIQII